MSIVLTKRVRTGDVEMSVHAHAGSYNSISLGIGTAGTIGYLSFDAHLTPDTARQLAAALLAGADAIARVAVPELAQ